MAAGNHTVPPRSTGYRGNGLRFGLRRGLGESPESAQRVAEFPQHPDFDLADTLTSKRESSGNFLESSLAVSIQAKAHPDDGLVTGRQCLQDGGHVFLYVDVEGHIGWRRGILILDEVTQLCVAFTSHWHCQRHCLLRNLRRFVHLFDAHLQAPGNLFGGGLTAQFLREFATGARLLIDRADDAWDPRLFSSNRRLP